MTEEVFCSFFWVGSQLASHGGGHGFQRRGNPLPARNLDKYKSLKLIGESGIEGVISTPPFLLAEIPLYSPFRVSSICG